MGVQQGDASQLEKECGQLGQVLLVTLKSSTTPHHTPEEMAKLQSSQCKSVISHCSPILSGIPIFILVMSATPQFEGNSQGI